MGSPDSREKIRRKEWWILTSARDKVRDSTRHYRQTPQDLETDPNAQYVGPSYANDSDDSEADDNDDTNSDAQADDFETEFPTILNSLSSIEMALDENQTQGSDNTMDIGGPNDVDADEEEEDDEFPLSPASPPFYTDSEGLVASL